MTDPSLWSFKLTREDVLARMARREQLAAQITSLQGELEAEDRWLEAISLILPPAFKATLPGAGHAEANETRSVWRRAVEPIIATATRGLLPREVAQSLKESGDEEIKERMARNPNGMYAAIDRLVEDGQAVRHRDKVYSKALFDALRESGELDDDTDEGGLSGSNLYIYNGLKTFGAMFPRQIIDMMKEDETFAAKIASNPQYGYSAIARLVRQGHIQKGMDGRYRLSSNENEPSDVSASNGSETASIFD